MRRQLRTPGQNVRTTADQTARPLVRQAFLIDTYSGYATEIAVTLTDPRSGSRGIVAKAVVRPGVVLPVIDAGTPVSVVIRHGRVEIIGLSASSAVTATVVTTNPVFHGTLVRRSSTTQSTTSGFDLTCAFPTADRTKDYDTDNWHDSATSPTDQRITPNIPGYYLVQGQVTFSANATGDRTAKILMNGSAIATTVSRATASGQWKGQLTQVASINGIGDYVELAAQQDSGGALNLAATGNLLMAVLMFAL